jgi:hypothetical protein
MIPECLPELPLPVLDGQAEVDSGDVFLSFDIFTFKSWETFLSCDLDLDLLVLAPGEAG